MRSVRAARWSAGWALLFIGLLYTTAPAIAVFAKYFMLSTLAGQPVDHVAITSSYLQPLCEAYASRGACAPWSLSK